MYTSYLVVIIELVTHQLIIANKRLGWKHK